MSYELLDGDAKDTKRYTKYTRALKAAYIKIVYASRYILLWKILLNFGNERYLH